MHKFFIEDIPEYVHSYLLDLVSKNDKYKCNDRSHFPEQVRYVEQSIAIDMIEKRQICL